jgi:rubredoxin
MIGYPYLASSFVVCEFRKLCRPDIPERANSCTEWERRDLMEKWKCTVCDWIYDPATGDPDGGIAPGTPFEKIPDTWLCPVCGASKDLFEKI